MLQICIRQYANSQQLGRKKAGVIDAEHIHPAMVQLQTTVAVGMIGVAMAKHGDTAMARCAKALYAII